jgi:hypothetical protein
MRINPITQIVMPKIVILNVDIAQKLNRAGLF